MDNNFNNLRNSMTKGLFENIIGDKKSNQFKKFINEVKKSEILKKQLDVYYLIENEKFEDKDDAKFFLDKSLLQFKKFTVKEIEDANNSIMESFGQTLDNKDKIYNLIISLYSKDSKIDVSVNKDFKNIYENMVGVKPVIKEELKKTDFSVSKKVIKRATALLNEKFSFFNDTEKKIFKSFVNNNPEQKEIIYNDLLKENLSLVKRKIYESEDSSVEDKLKEIEKKINSDSYNNLKQIGDYVKLLELNKNLQ